jgi:lipocalin-like protein
MRALFLTLLLAISAPLFAADADGLVGTWKLVSWQVIVEDETPRNVFGAHPNGFLVLTREGRAIVLTTAQDRRPGMGDAERATLHNPCWPTAVNTVSKAMTS